MKALPCPCPALPRCWRPGSHSMAEGSGTQSLGKGPPLSVQLLRAQYELWRRQQRAQAHLVVLPKGRARQVLGRRGGEERRVPGQEGRRGGRGCVQNGGWSCRQGEPSWWGRAGSRVCRSQARIRGTELSSVPAPAGPGASTQRLAGSPLFLASALML